MSQWDQRVNHYDYTEEVLQNVDFTIQYGYDSHGNLWTNFNIPIAIGSLNDAFNFFGSGSLDQWPPQWPRQGSTHGWPEPKSQTPRVVDQSGNPILTTPRTGEPGVRIDPNCSAGHRRRGTTCQARSEVPTRTPTRSRRHSTAQPTTEDPRRCRSDDRPSAVKDPPVHTPPSLTTPNGEDY